MIHFICRGNAFRSVIAEAYLRSLRIKDLEILSSGTIAERSKVGNKVNFQKTLALLRRHGLERFAKSHYADQLEQSRLANNDIAVCMNPLVYDECKSTFKLPAKIFVWDIIDLGEKGRISTTEKEREAYAEEAYHEIVRHVDELVSQELSALV
jgi:protein-tyrosine-phosphatase